MQFIIATFIETKYLFVIGNLFHHIFDECVFVRTSGSMATFSMTDCGTRIGSKECRLSWLDFVTTDFAYV